MKANPSRTLTDFTGKELKVGDTIIVNANISGGWAMKKVKLIDTKKEKWSEARVHFEDWPFEWTVFNRTIHDFLIISDDLTDRFVMKRLKE